MEWQTWKNSTVNGPSSSTSLARDRVELDLVQQATLAQLDLGQAQGQPRSEDRHVELLQHVGQRADVVLVAVGQDDALDLVGPLAPGTRCRE